MTPPFLDTNIVLRHLLQDDPEQSPKASAMLERVEHGDLSVLTTDIVIFETVFTLQRTYRASREAICEGVLPILELPGIELPGKRLLRRAFELFLTTRLGFADCYHVAVMERAGSDHVLSFDRGFDEIDWITRSEGEA